MWHVGRTEGIMAGILRQISTASLVYHWVLHDWAPRNPSNLQLNHKRSPQDRMRPARKETAFTVPDMSGCKLPGILLTAGWCWRLCACNNTRQKAGKALDKSLNSASTLGACFRNCINMDVLEILIAMKTILRSALLLDGHNFLQIRNPSKPHGSLRLRSPPGRHSPSVSARNLRQKQTGIDGLNHSFVQLNSMRVLNSR